VTLADYFPLTICINRADRPDRRRQTERMLARVGWPSAVQFFPAVIPTERERWPTLGCRGCYESHLAVLRIARARNLDRVLILEDDCELDRQWVRDPAADLAYASAVHPGIWYLGHDQLEFTRGRTGLTAWPSDEPLTLLHCYAVSRWVYEPLITFLSECAIRPVGDPDGGPQYPDGAISMFRWRNPGVTTLVSLPAVARQRRSRSDVTPGHWFDRAPGLRRVADLARSVRRRIAGGVL
jgi:glycosyl transferase family 25